MRDNPIQFAVVREDPHVELEVLRRHPCRRLLLIASGGCTALSLQAAQPDLELTLLDTNPAQLQLVRDKVEALESAASSGDRTDLRRRFNVEDDDPSGLCECGNFESLFRGLRGFLDDFVLPRSELRRLLEEPGALAEAPARLFASRYWPAAFRTFFSDTLLETMFGPEATQHAATNSYGPYFEAALRGGLTRPDATQNRFLHHILLGHYLEGAPPAYLCQSAPRHRFELVEGSFDRDNAALDLGSFDLIHLSNIMDWMDEDSSRRLLHTLREGVRPGCVVLWRQLNNRRDLERPLADLFDFDPAWQADLLHRDRSLFYSSLHVGLRRGSRP